MILDDIFGPENFQSEIIWSFKRWSNSKKGLMPSHQTILFYARSNEFKFNPITTAYSESTNVDQILQKRVRDTRGKTIYARDDDGEPVSNGAKRGVPLGDVWEIPFLNPKAKERVGYPTQKPILLLERIIQLCTEPSDLVVDPFCGSGTTVVAAKLLDRRAIGIDVSNEALDLANQRLKTLVRTESKLMENGRDSYVRSDLSILKCLDGIDYHAVQRNKGIDAILTEEWCGKPVCIRIQRTDETIDAAAAALCKAARKKGGAKLVLIVTNNNRGLLGTQQLPASVSLVRATAAAVRDCLSTLPTSMTDPAISAQSTFQHAWELPDISERA
jgi:site-specific DNA-methyltransferase (adenine-specific)